MFAGAWTGIRRFFLTAYETGALLRRALNAEARVSLLEEALRTAPSEQTLRIEVGRLRHRVSRLEDEVSDLRVAHSRTKEGRR